jgi:hypothetical protein
VVRNGRVNIAHLREVYIMGFISELFTSAANGAINSAVRGSQGGARLIEALCSQNGWSIDERIGKNGIILNFKDPLFGIRPLLVTTSDNSDLVVLSSHSRAQFRPDSVPPQLAYYLLLQNKNASFHAWQVAENDNGTVGFSVLYSTMANALTAPIFKTICEKMCEEAINLDVKLRQAGMI